MASAPPDLESKTSQSWRGRVQSTRKALKRAPVIPIAVAGVVVLAAVFAEALAPHDPGAVFLMNRLEPPVWHAEGTWTHALGTDAVGRDILSRIIFGARVSLVVASAALIIGASVGTLLGMISGFVGGRVDTVLMRLVDMALGFPMLLFALLLAATFGPSQGVVIVAISAVLWARFARVVRGEALSLRERDFILMARVAGTSTSKTILRHILPNVANTVVVIGSLQLGWTILVEASLSFLGAGIPPPTPAWGSMTAQGRDHLASAYWISLLPGIAIMFAVLAFNLLGDWLRDRLDPKLQSSLT